MRDRNLAIGGTGSETFIELAVDGIFFVLKIREHNSNGDNNFVWFQLATHPGRDLSVAQNHGWSFELEKKLAFIKNQ